MNFDKRRKKIVNESIKLALKSMYGNESFFVLLGTKLTLNLHVIPTHHSLTQSFEKFLSEEKSSKYPTT